ncbi:MAG: alpha/beta hydrolase fold domain-containing protein [Bacteroidota bacterium]|nr:alpha/beta hydrolase fold domain-containing protein [Bacteroidota bacterium]
MNPSFTSSVFVWILNVINFKKRIERRALKQKPVSKNKFPPDRFRRSYLVNLQAFHAKGIATFQCQEKVTKNHIIFFHGGAYLFKTTRAHWRLSEKIVRKSFCRMTHIDYPLAPEHHYKDTFNMVSGAYELLGRQYPEDNFILMGDSAGGGLALAFAQKLIKEKHKKLPAKIILLSPWLDLSMSNPDIEKLESTDHILTLKMLQYAGMKYSDGDRPDHYLLSPIHGEFTNLPQTIVFYGSEELFSADCKRLKSITNSNRKNFIFREYKKMQHDWAIFPIPESRQLVNEVCGFINGKNK